MSFQYEREMVGPAMRWLRKQGLMVKSEFPTPWGICDLVGCSLNKHKVKKRLALRQRQPIRSELRVHLLSLIPEKDEGKSVSVDDLYRVFEPYLDKERIEVELQRLAKGRFVRSAEVGMFYKVNGWMPLHKRLVAVELKLSRVDDALHQAINNLEFAHESFAAFPVDVVRRIVTGRRKADFQAEGIGVVAVAPEGCRVLLRPAARHPRNDTTMQAYCVERFWLPHLKGNRA